jgi:hypothetical protein
VLPYLHELGERWASGEASVGQEHFASQLIRGRLLGLARGWDRGSGPRALLACAPGEQHDLGLIVFGVALRARGWRITYLGQDTPLETLAESARSLGPLAIVISSVSPDRLSRSGPSCDAWRALHTCGSPGQAPAKLSPRRRAQHSSTSTRWPQLTA